MARDVNGNYTLPLPDVITGDTIEASWANTTLADLEAEITDSLSRSGSGGMQTALELVDGSVSAPGWAFNSETNTGMYRASAGQLVVTVGGVDIFRFNSANKAQVYDTTWRDVVYAGETDYDFENVNVGTKLTLGNTTLVTDDEFYIDASDSKTPRIWWGQYEQSQMPHLAQKFDRQNGIFYLYSNEDTGAFTRYFMSGDTLYHDVSSVVIQEVGVSNWDGYIGNGDTRGKFTMRAGNSASTSYIEISGQNQATTPGRINLVAPKDINLLGSQDVGTSDATISLQSDNITLSANTNDVGIYITTGSREIVIDNQFKFIGVPLSDPAVNLALFQDSGVLRISDGTAATDTVVMQDTGTFTPTIQDASGSDAEGQTYSVQDGHYVKQGPLVFFTIRVTTTSLGTLSGALRVAGLPYTSSATIGKGRGHFVCHAGTMSLPADQSIYGVLNDNSNHISLILATGGSGSSSATPTEVTNTAVLEMSGTYITDS